MPLTWMVMMMMTGIVINVVHTYVVVVVVDIDIDMHLIRFLLISDGDISSSCSSLLSGAQRR